MNDQTKHELKLNGLNLPIQTAANIEQLWLVTRSTSYLLTCQYLGSDMMTT